MRAMAGARSRKWAALPATHERRAAPRRARPAALVVWLSMVGCASDDVVSDDVPVASSVDGSEGRDDDSDTDGGSPGVGAVVLRPEDLGTGWTEVPADQTVAGGNCLDALTVPGGPFDVEVAASAAYAQSELGPFLAAAAVPGDVDTVLAEVDDVLVACDGSVGDDGFTTTIEPAALEGLPPGSLAVRGISEDERGSGVDFTLVGAGTEDVTVLVLAATPLGEVDDDVVVAAINAMIDRA